MGVEEIEQWMKVIDELLNITSNLSDHYSDCDSANEIHSHYLNAYWNASGLYDFLKIELEEEKKYQILKLQQKR